VAEELAASCATAALPLGLEAELPAALLDDVTATLPKGLRARAMALDLAARDLLSAGLVTALDELGAGESLARAGH
jgi:hypothetical protein